MNFFVDNQLRLMVLDKEGRFVVLQENAFSANAMRCISKNFKHVYSKSSRMKEQAMTFLLECGLQHIASAGNRAQEDTFQVFFASKTHEVYVPFRSIVSERHTW